MKVVGAAEQTDASDSACPRLPEVSESIGHTRPMNTPAAKDVVAHPDRTIHRCGELAQQRLREKEGQGGLGVEPPGVQRAHETDEEMRLVQAGLDKDGIHFDEDADGGLVHFVS